MPKFRTLSLKTRILLWASLLVFAAIWALAVRVTAVLRADLEQMVASHMSATVDYVGSDIDNKIQLRIDALREIAASITPEILADPPRLNRLLAQRNVSRQLFPIGIFVANRQGINIAEHPRVEGRLGGSVADRDYFRAVMESDDMFIGKPLKGRFWKQAISAIAFPLRDASGATAGVLLGAMMLSGPELFGQLEQSRIGKTGLFLVISPKDRLFVSATDKTRILTPLPAPGVNPILDKRIATGFETVAVGVNSQGVETLSVSHKLRTTGWIIIAAIATEEAFAPLDKLRWQIYFATLGISLALVMVLRYILVRQLAPLAEASAAMRLMTQDEKTLTVLPVRHDDEIGQMVENFNSLVVERQRLEQALQSKTEALLRANADLTRFTEVSAHHLMEPARRLTSYAQFLRVRLAGLPLLSEDEEARISLETLEQDAGRLRGMVRDIQLYLAAGEPRGEVSMQDANAALQAVERRLAPQIAELGVKLDIQPLPPANLDRPRLTDLFAILLENALRHGRPADPEVKPQIRIHGERDGAMSRYHVGDNGPGIPNEYLERVFGIFERLSAAGVQSSPGAGTGIGLSIARRIIESRQGRIWIETLPQGGAMVVFELPDGEIK
ncbi:MAG: ATP-binding protein [Sterolibacterium sp.]